MQAALDRIAPIRLVIITRAGVICDTIEYELNGHARSLPNVSAAWQALHDNSKMHRAVVRHFDHDNNPTDTEWLASAPYLHRKNKLV